MALSRIWTAFIIIGIAVGTIRMVGGDQKIFNRMVVGKSTDKYDSVFYATVGSPVNLNLSPKYGDFLKEYGYYKVDSVHKPTVLLTDNLASDSVAIIHAANPNIQDYTYLSIQRHSVDSQLPVSRQIGPDLRD